MLKLPILILFPHSRCNCRCVMCDIWKAPGAQELDMARHLDEIRALGVEWIVFSGGEPLLAPGLFSFCASLREAGICTTVLSTGILVSRFARQIAETVDELIVSLDGPPDVHNRIRGIPRAFELLAEGVRALGDFPVAGRCTVQKLNCGFLADTVSTARELGLRWISFLAADLTTTAFNRPDGWSAARRAEIAVEDMPELEREIARILPEAGGYVRETPEKLRRIAAHFRGEHEAPPCVAPWVSAVVEADGLVRPCFFHEPVGRLGSLVEVLDGERARVFREGLNVAENPICRTCVCSLSHAPARS